MIQLQRIREAQARHPGTLLLFRVGDCYELFGDDAATAARQLGLCLTKRTGKVTGETLALAGFPQRFLEANLRQLLQYGHRLAICEQLEDTEPEDAVAVTRRTLFDRLEQ
jgi:DNA mismatch repair protein MutS